MKDFEKGHLGRWNAFEMERKKVVCVYMGDKLFVWLKDDEVDRRLCLNNGDEMQYKERKRRRRRNCVECLQEV